MSQKWNLRITAAVGAVTLVAAMAPSAQAAEVCNQARKGHEGAYNATGTDPSTPARYQKGLEVLGTGPGLTRAAGHSPALSECALPGSGSDIVVPPPWT